MSRFIVRLHLHSWMRGAGIIEIMGSSAPSAARGHPAEHRVLPRNELQSPAGTLPVCALLALALTATPIAAAELHPAAAEGYARHADAASRAFPARARSIASGPRCGGVMRGFAGRGDGILTVPDGLVHHWTGAAFIPGAAIERAVDVSRDYASYPEHYKAVLSARVLSQQRDTYNVLLRIREGEAGVTAVLDVRSTVEYRPQAGGAVLAISASDEIRQVENAGQRDERLLPPGRDSGYLWRAHTFTYLAPAPGGVFVVMETLGLSRRFPPMLGWLIEPIARRLGRKSVEESLTEFATAVRATTGGEPFPSCSPSGTN